MKLTFIRKNVGLIAAFSVIGAIMAVLVIAFLNEINIANSNAAYGHKVIVKTPEKIVAMSPPPSVPSAEIVAQRLHCKRFQNIGVSGGVQGIVLDEGSCYIGNVKYAIDTFQNSKIRDTWLKMSEPLGVIPAFETATSVTYKSVTG